MTDETCRRKIPYTSQREARLALKKSQRRRGAPELEVYRCPVCGWYHLGAKRRRLGRADRGGKLWVG